MSENTYSQEIERRIHDQEKWIENLKTEKKNGKITEEQFNNRIARSNLARDLLTERAKKQARIDHLTQLPNRRWFEEELNNEIIRSNRTGEALGLLLVDVDQLKEVNDRYGHETGDRLLQFIADKARKIVRGTDFFARISGDEFAAIVIKPEDLFAVADRYRRSIEESPIPGTEIKVTVSIGGSFYSKDEPKKTWINRVDQALYAAKHSDRNNTKIM